MKHTKGPWILHQGIESSTGRPVATTSLYMDSDKVEETNAENEANARLITKAPEMLAICKSIIDCTSIDNDGRVSINTQMHIDIIQATSKLIREY